MTAGAPTPSPPPTPSPRTDTVRHVGGSAGGAGAAVLGVMSLLLTALPWLFYLGESEDPVDDAFRSGFAHFFGWILGGGALFLGGLGVVVGIVAVASGKAASRVVAVTGAAIAALGLCSAVALMTVLDLL